MLNFFTNDPVILAFFETKLSLLEAINESYKKYCGDQKDQRKVEEVIYRLISCKNEKNHVAIDNLIAVMRQEENIVFTDEAKVFLKTPQALYAFAHIASCTFYIVSAQVPKVIKDEIKT